MGFKEFEDLVLKPPQDISERTHDNCLHIFGKHCERLEAAKELLREKVVCVAAGLRHALAATASGIVFQWGTGLASSGRRLCPGQTLPPFLTAKEPSRVTGLENSKATYVLAGSDHSASLTGKDQLSESNAPFGVLHVSFGTQREERRLGVRILPPPLA
nr:secretion-regulating guanine nucleotide exchange factor-like [Mirounga angustirostris]